MRQHWSPIDIALMGLSALACSAIFAATYLLLVEVGDYETAWVKTSLIGLAAAAGVIAALALVGAGIAKISGVPEHVPATRVSADSARDVEHVSQPTDRAEASSATVDDRASTKRRWGPGSYIGMGILGVVIFGLPGVTRSTGSSLFDTILTIGGIVAAIWLLIGVVSFGVRAAQRQD
jgi:hypothetical protein